MAETSYFYIDQSTWNAWVDALGFASASKLAGACMAYYFTGELSDSVKLAKVAKALFEGERSRLDARRSKASAKAAKVSKIAPEVSPTNVEKSGGKRNSSGQSSKKSAKKSGKVHEKTTQTSPVPAETSDHSKPKPKPNAPQTPRADAVARGSGAMGGSVMSSAEYAELSRVLGFDAPTSYGAARERLRAV